mmetsp:Transcript_1473/g.5254  ORF Transcript_1473/g.5254 Transcript_1473/m.5254 type:complete len:216 (+) Transcript_1473:252-899(+)
MRSAAAAAPQDARGLGRWLAPAVEVVAGGGLPPRAAVRARRSAAWRARAHPLLALRRRQVPLGQDMRRGGVARRRASARVGARERRAMGCFDCRSARWPPGRLLTLGCSATMVQPMERLLTNGAASHSRLPRRRDVLRGGSDAARSAGARESALNFQPPLGRAHLQRARSGGQHRGAQVGARAGLPVQRGAGERGPCERGGRRQARRGAAALLLG